MTVRGGSVMKWKDVPIGGTMVQWDQPKIIEGKYLGSEERTTENGTNLVHSVKLANGEIVRFFGTTLLNSGLAKVTLDSYVQIEYTDKSIKTRRFKMKDFRIRVGEEDGAPVAGNGRSAQAP